MEVHHTEADKRNEPGSEEILEPGTHDTLFNKKTVPGINDDASKHHEYMERVSKIARENTPDQAVVVFPGTGIVNGEETKDLTQVIYADDMPGVTELVNQAIAALRTTPMMKYIPETDEDSRLLEQLLKTPGEAEELDNFCADQYKRFYEKNYFIKYKGINIFVQILNIP